MKKREILRDFPKLLKEIREDRRFTQEQLLYMLRKQGYEKYSKGDVSKWEHGYYRPPAGVIEVLEDILKTPPGLLLDAADYCEEAEVKRQENVISQLKEYIKEEFKFLAAQLGLKYKDIHSGEWVTPSPSDKIEAFSKGFEQDTESYHPSEREGKI